MTIVSRTTSRRQSIAFWLLLAAMVMTIAACNSSPTASDSSTGLLPATTFPTSGAGSQVSFSPSGVFTYMNGQVVTIPDGCISVSPTTIDPGVGSTILPITNATVTFQMSACAQLPVMDGNGVHIVFGASDETGKGVSAWIFSSSSIMPGETTMITLSGHWTGGNSMFSPPPPRLVSSIGSVITWQDGATVFCTGSTGNCTQSNEAIFKLFEVNWTCPTCS